MDYYIRSWDPDSTYPANPQEGDVCYTITLDQSWAPVAGVKNDNLLKEEIYQNGEWVEVGGGGSSIVVLYDGSIETTLDGNFAYSEDTAVQNEFAVDFESDPPNFPDLTIIFEGVTYDSVPFVVGNGYGAPWDDDNSTYDFTDYPFNVYLSSISEAGLVETFSISTATAGEYDIEISGIPNGSGGGGESDYSTCTVTLAGGLYINNPMFALPILIEGKDGIGLESAVNVPPESSEDYTVVLYKGQAIAMNKETTSSVSGDVTKAYSAGDMWYTYTITGDCTITIGSNK